MWCPVRWAQGVASIPRMAVAAIRGRWRMGESVCEPVRQPVFLVGLRVGSLAGFPSVSASRFANPFPYRVCKPACNAARAASRGWRWPCTKAPAAAIHG